MSRSWGVELDMWTAIALSCGALCVYSLDHWGDARRIIAHPRESISSRRAFYVEAQMTLLALTFVSVALGLWASLHLTRVTLYAGLGFVGLCALYLWGIQRATRLPKELIVCIMYAAALSLPAITTSPLTSPLTSPIDSSTWGIDMLHGVCASALIGCLAWANLCLISAHELTQDRAEDTRSIATSRGEVQTRSWGRRGLYVGALLWSVWIISGGALSRVSGWIDATLSAAMLLTLTALYSSPRWSAERARYRICADLIFIYPLLSVIAT